MINFRFHVVSLTAVLLALGVGLVLGTTFLDDALEEALKDQLSGLEESLDRARVRNGELQGELDRFSDESDELQAQLGERLYQGQLEGDAVLVVSTRGVDEELVEGVTSSLVQADADLVGVWWLTDRLALDDDAEVEDLSTALQQSTDDAERLERSLARQLADVAFGAADVGDEASEAEQPAPAEPPLLSRLREGGFVQYQLPEGAEGDVVRLPASGLRIVVVDGPGAQVPASQVLQPMLTELTVEGPVPVVAVQPEEVRDEEDEDAPALLVRIVRDDDTLSERLSTVDALDRVSGRVATVLATVDAIPGDPVIGHYGTGDGSSRLVPPAAGDG
ncbi:MAG TPA: copper transporter [Acidimicrobiales bacterium]|nr:copper transporter [Acidimicrobiales bacterium]